MYNQYTWKFLVEVKIMRRYTSNAISCFTPCFPIWEILIGQKITDSIEELTLLEFYKITRTVIGCFNPHIISRHITC